MCYCFSKVGRIRSICFSFWILGLIQTNCKCYCFVPIGNGPVGMILVSHDSPSFTVMRSTYSAAERSCLVSKHVGILGKIERCGTRGRLSLPCTSRHNYVYSPASHSGYGYLYVTLFMSLIYIIFKLSFAAQQLAAGLTYNPNFTFQNFPGLELMHQWWWCDVVNDTTPALKSWLSLQVSQRCSRVHGMPLLNLAAACAAGIPHWMWMTSPCWILFPVQLATGNNGDNTNSHWSTISDLLSVYYGGGLWPQAVVEAQCQVQLGAKQSEFIVQSILSQGSVELLCCSLWILEANHIFKPSFVWGNHLVHLGIFKDWVNIRTGLK